MAIISLDSGLSTKPRQRPHTPRWIIRECGQCGGHPIPFEIAGWEAVLGFALQGWFVMRDGDAVRIWFADTQEGTA